MIPMEPAFTFVQGSKEEKYRELIPQLNALLEGERDVVASLGNVAAALKMNFYDFNWVGFYFLSAIADEHPELILGPFQGKPACTRIKVGEGVCGTSVERLQTVIVPDVRKFPGHIYCDPDSQSEIVVPLVQGRKVLGVLDIDSDRPGAFDEVDQRFLENIASEVVRKIRQR